MQSASFRYWKLSSCSGSHTNSSADFAKILSGCACSENRKMNLELKLIVQMKLFRPSWVTGRGADFSALTFLGLGLAPCSVNRNPCHSIC